MKRYWIRWAQPTEGEQPLKVPPNPAIIGWWRFGYTCDHERDLPVVPILCALVEADDKGQAVAAIKQEWPKAEMPQDDLTAWSLVRVGLDWRPPRNRFPILSWMMPRLCPPIAAGVCPSCRMNLENCDCE